MYLYLFAEDKSFWKAIVELGLVDEFFREIKAKLDGLKHSMIKNYVPIDGKLICFYIKAIVELGLVDEFFREIKAKPDGLKHSMIKNCSYRW